MKQFSWARRLSATSIKHAYDCGHFAGYGSFPYRKNVHGEDWVKPMSFAFRRAYAKGYRDAQIKMRLARLVG